MDSTSECDEIPSENFVLSGTDPASLKNTKKTRESIKNS